MVVELCHDVATWTEGDKNQELERYAAHAGLLTQAIGFLTHITTTAGLYATISGAAWTVVAANTFGAEPVTLFLVLVLHIALSFGVAFAMWGMANNFIQRLNLARWLGVFCWPHVEALGGTAWRGVPGKRKDGQICVQEFNQWDAESPERETHHKSWQPLLARKLDHWLRYRAMQWPSLRYQRLWAIVPILGALGSIWLLIEVQKDDRQRRELCRQAADALSFPVAAPISREAFERARYVFDKASCNITRIDSRRLRTGE